MNGCIAHQRGYHDIFISNDAYWGKWGARKERIKFISRSSAISDARMLPQLPTKSVASANSQDELRALDQQSRRFRPSASDEDPIRYMRQRFEYDCGHACLAMLGYDSYNMFPKGEQITSDNLHQIAGVKQVGGVVGQEETHDYSSPHIWNILAKEGAQHWVIRHKDSIYCPTVGVMNAAEYKQRYVAHVLQIFRVPVAKR
jgi:hypothetical protein